MIAKMNGIVMNSRIFKMKIMKYETCIGLVHRRKGKIYDTHAQHQNGHMVFSYER